MTEPNAVAFVAGQSMKIQEAEPESVNRRNSRNIGTQIRSSGRPPVSANSSPERGGRKQHLEDYFLQVLSVENARKAWRKVRANNGAPGSDGVTVRQLAGSFESQWTATRLAILSSAYRPTPLRRVEIPKPDGGVRVLRIPAVIDRVVQQGIAQVIAPLWEPFFSPNSYAYRPNRGAQDAVLAAQHCLEHGFPWAAKIDIENFFDSIPHNRLLLKLGTRVNDPRLLTLIELFLSSACCRLDKADRVEMGAPQGSPLSPLLSNVLLDDFDKFLEAQEIRFVRYADDCMAFAASEPEAVTILRKAGEFLTGKLGLKLNQAKSRAVPPGRITFLGFALLQGDGNSIYRDISQENIMQFRARIEQLARFTPGRSFDEMIREVSSFVRGWCAYYGIVQRPWRLNQLRSHARLAARRYLWKSWATPENRMRELVARGVPADAASELSKEEYPAAPLQHPAMAEAIPNAFFEGVGLANVKFSRPSYGPPAPRACASTYSHPLLPPPQAANKLDSLPELEPGAGAKTAAAPLPHPEAAGRGFDCSFRITLGRFFDLNISYCNPPAGKPKEAVPK